MFAGYVTGVQFSKNDPPLNILIIDSWDKIICLISKKDDFLFQDDVQQLGLVGRSEHVHDENVAIRGYGHPPNAMVVAYRRLGY